MKKITLVGMLLILLVSLGACCRPAYWHGGKHGANWHNHSDRQGHLGWHKTRYGRYR
ncbi:MAG: hypothetical protein GXY53_05075 [Desulfobulbus sp.]|nr:hypothetical protein [Desulfobulbus sp.]